MMTDVDMIQAMARAIAPDRWFIYDHEHICNPEWANTRVALSRLQATVALTVIQPELDRLRAEIKVLTEINVNLVAERDERLKAADETIDRLRAENTDLIHREKVRREAINKSMNDANERADREQDRANLALKLFDQREEYLTGLNAINTELREALKPFARRADRYDSGEADDEEPDWSTAAPSIRVGDLRRARTALEGRDV